MRSKPKNQKKIYTWFFCLIVVVLSILAVFIIWRNDAKAPASEKPQTETRNTQTELPNPPANDDQKQTAVKEIFVPILMYHYIRTVADQNDKLGINLSVTPERFADQLDYLREKGYQTITFNDLENGNVPEKPVILTFDDGYSDFYTAAYPELKRHEMTAVSFVIADKTDQNYLSKYQIKDLSDNSIEIGSHTLTHPDLANLSEARQSQEIGESKTKLEAIIGKKVISFCYPAGRYNDETVSLVNQNGYKYSVTTKSGIGDLKNPFLLSRYRMNADTSISTYLK